MDIFGGGRGMILQTTPFPAVWRAEQGEAGPWHGKSQCPWGGCLLHRAGNPRPPQPGPGSTPDTLGIRTSLLFLFARLQLCSHTAARIENVPANSPPGFGLIAAWMGLGREVWLWLGKEGPRHGASAGPFRKGKVWDWPGGSVVKNPPARAEDLGSIPDPGRPELPQSN